MATYWRPGATRPAVAPSIDREPHREGAAVVYNAQAGLSLSQQRRRLPIASQRRSLLYMVETFGTTVVVGHTGCGKTTQLPQFLHEAGWTADGRVVACTQPRRVAATSVAQRVAEEMGVELGSTVGYAVRFDDRFDEAATRIKYMTDGRLIREMMSDPLLSQYSVIMVDEAHERSTQTDVLLGLLKKVRRKRPELRLIIASATLDAEAFVRFFEDGVGPDGQPATPSAAIVTLEGAGVHQVTWHFLEEAVQDYLESAVDTVLRIHEREPGGDILLFLTGQQEVDAAVTLLTERSLQQQQQRKHSAAAARRRGGGGGGSERGFRGGAPEHLLALPIYSGLSADAQLRVFEPPPAGSRKVIVATNIAETSITIDGVVYVVDCGFTKLRVANPSGEEALVVAPQSRASARQRAGRSGRSRPGSYYSLMTEGAFEGLEEQTKPEMQRCALAAVVLQLKALGVDNVVRFDFLSPPPPEALSHALESLYALGALDGTGALTHPRGARMALLPLEPQVAGMLLSASGEGCEEEALTLAALLSVHSPFAALRPAELAIYRAPFAVYEGDALTVPNAYRAYKKRAARDGEWRATSWCRKHRLDERVFKRVGQVRHQLKRHLAGHERLGKAAGGGDAGAESGGAYDGADAIRRALVRGFFANAAQQVSGGVYRSVLRGASLRLHPNSVLYSAPPEWVLFHETVHGKYELMLSATKIEEDWLSELAPHYYVREKTRRPDAQPSGSTMGQAAGTKRPAALAGVCTADGAEEGGRGAATRLGAQAPGGFAAMLGESLARGTFGGAPERASVRRS